MRYIYQYKDHLGNVRVSFTKTGTGEIKIMDRNDYYPFGMNFLKGNQLTVYDPMAIPYNYKYNGKELQETGMYDYGARMYMPDIGRWGTIDPLAETSRRWSPYTYVYDNPIRFIDPTGMVTEDPNKVYKGGDIQEVIIVAVKPVKSGFINGLANGTVNAFKDALTLQGFRDIGQDIVNFGRDLVDPSSHTPSTIFNSGTLCLTGNCPDIDPGPEVDIAAQLIDSMENQDYYAVGNTVGTVSVAIAMIFITRGEATVIEDAVGGEIIATENSPYLTVKKADKTFHIDPNRVKEYVKNPKNSKSRWGDMVNFKKYGVPKGSEIIKGAGKGHKRTPTSGEIKMYNDHFNK